MTLRARLAIAITALLAVMVLGLGSVAVRSAQRVLVGQVDAGLIETVDRFRGGIPELGDGRIPLRQTYAIVVIDRDGGGRRGRPGRVRGRTGAAAGRHGDRAPRGSPWRADDDPFGRG